ncbi:MAG: hypothetical protein K2O04_06920 [Clostridiales bacterium]|nr:hypothetical protein [Clostridiales bacterium]
MKIYLDENISLNEDSLMEMANLRQKRTGIVGEIWVDEGAYRRDIKHGKYRIKYENAGSSVYIKFANDEPEVVGKYKKTDLSELPKVIEWIKINRPFLIKLYDRVDDYDIMDFITDMKPVKS